MTDPPRPWDRPPREPLPPEHRPQFGVTPWTPMADRVHALVQQLALLEPLREAAGADGFPPLVHGFEDAVEIAYMPRRHRDHLAHRIVKSEWWVPRRGRSQSEWSVELAERLARELRRLWDERQAWEVRQQKPGPR